MADFSRGDVGGRSRRIAGEYALRRADRMKSADRNLRVLFFKALLRISIIACQAPEDFHPQL
jgi:hypothetical protein